MHIKEHLEDQHADVPWKIRSRYVHPATSEAEAQAGHHAMHMVAEPETHSHAWVASDL